MSSDALPVTARSVENRYLESNEAEIMINIKRNPCLPGRCIGILKRE
jgi:hypothetical protein